MPSAAPNPYYTLAGTAPQNATDKVRNADIVLTPEYAAKIGQEAAAAALAKAQVQFCGMENERRHALKMHLDSLPPPTRTAREIGEYVRENAHLLDPLAAGRHEAIEKLKADGRPDEAARLAPPYVVDEFAEPLFRALCLYFARDPRFETEDATGKRKLHKGLLLAGNVGAGKSTLLRIFRRCNPAAGMSYNEASYAHLEAAYCNQDEKKGGIAGLAKYCRNPYFLDDMGREQPESIHYGVRKNVFDVVLEARYQQGLPAHTLHITSNLSELGIYHRYEKRIYSRIIENFNILSFPAKAPDRRTTLDQDAFTAHIAALQAAEDASK